MESKAEKIAYLNAQILCAQAEIEGMKALNQYRDRRGETIAYDDEAFFSIPSKYGLEKDQIFKLLN